MTAPFALPEHVAPNLVFDFDIYNDDRLKADLHAGFKSLHDEAPEIFYTPQNGGHWMITRFDTMSAVLRDFDHFSNSQMNIPKTDTPYVMIPLNLDPPDHTPFRSVLLRYFAPQPIADMEPVLRGWAAKLIDPVVADGGCDFTERLGAGFPVSIFMEMMGLPMDRFEVFRSVVVEFFSFISNERRVELQKWIFDEMETLILARMKAPEKDLISHLISEDIGDRTMTVEELKSMCFLLFIAGLDTVANMLTFAFHHLATDQGLQTRLRENPDKIPDFVDEALRRFAIVNGVRMVKRDISIGDAHLKAGDMVVCSLPMGGMDERKNACPMDFDIDRTSRFQVSFSIGAHFCVGNALARAEMRVFTQEWLDRIPNFRVANGFKPEFRAGLVMALNHLPLEW